MMKDMKDIIGVFGERKNEGFKSLGKNWNEEFESLEEKKELESL